MNPQLSISDAANTNNEQLTVPATSYKFAIGDMLTFTFRD